jgi:D-glycero-beta-D-manno-heptose-7-phosphate kinase
MPPQSFVSFPEMARDRLPLGRIKTLLKAAARRRILVVGDVLLDHFIWGTVTRISPEAPVPVVEFQRESSMPGGAANVARNLSALGVTAELFGLTGKDAAARELKRLLKEDQVDCQGLLSQSSRPTSIKTRIVAHQQQVVRVDREVRSDNDPAATRRLLTALEPALLSADALIVGDYGKGVVTQMLLDALKQFCRARGIWLSLDPKPVHRLNLTGLSLLTPNRKEAFELARAADGSRADDPLQDSALLAVVDKLLREFTPALMLVTLGDQGLLLCQRGQAPFLIPTVAQEVFDVSGAGDTVIASFTLAVAAGASPVEAAIFSNHAAGVVVGKVGTATVTPAELLTSFGA